MDRLEEDVESLRKSREREVQEVRAKERAKEKAHEEYLRSQFLKGIDGAFSRLKERTNLVIDKTSNNAAFTFKGTKFFLCFNEYEAPIPADDCHGTYTTTKWVLRKDNYWAEKEAYITGHIDKPDMYKQVLEAIEELLKPEPIRRW